MSLKKTYYSNISYLICLILVSCSAYNSLPNNWDKDIPGTYEGVFNSFKEIMEFNTDGDFRHEVLEGDKSILNEHGKWSVIHGKYIINLDRFTQYYDPLTGTISTNCKHFIYYEYYPLPDGKKFYKISTDVDFRYCLTRKRTDDSGSRSASQNTNR